MAGANGGLSNHVKDTCRSRGTLIKAHLSVLNVATERGTSDMTEATHFSQCVHDQQRRLEAEDCDSIRCAQLISGGRRRMRPPQCLSHARPTMCCIHLVIYSMGSPIYLGRIPNYCTPGAQRWLLKGGPRFHEVVPIFTAPPKL